MDEHVCAMTELPVQRDLEQNNVIVAAVFSLQPLLPCFSSDTQHLSKQTPRLFLACCPALDEGITMFLSCFPKVSMLLGLRLNPRGESPADLPFDADFSKAQTV